MVHMVHMVHMTHMVYMVQVLAVHTLLNRLRSSSSSSRHPAPCPGTDGTAMSNRQTGGHMQLTYIGAREIGELTCSFGGCCCGWWC